MTAAAMVSAQDAGIHNHSQNPIRGRAEAIIMEMTCGWRGAGGIKGSVIQTKTSCEATCCLFLLLCKLMKSSPMNPSRLESRPINRAAQIHSGNWANCAVIWIFIFFFCLNVLVFITFTLACLCGVNTTFLWYWSGYARFFSFSFFVVNWQISFGDDRMSIKLN